MVSISDFRMLCLRIGFAASFGLFGEAHAQPATEGSPAQPADVDLEALAANLGDLSLGDLLEIHIPEVTGVSKRAESIHGAPATIVVITRQEIRLRGYSTLVDVLRDAPGMEVNDHYWSEFGALVPVRGVVGNNKIVVLLDGARVNPPGGEPMMLRSDFGVREAERIEIIYGPGSTMYGQDAISAVINVITKKPGEGQTFEGGLRGGYPTSGEGWAAFRGTLENVGVSAYAQYLRASPSDMQSLDPERYAAYESIAESLGGDAGYSRPEQALNAGVGLHFDNSHIQAWLRRFDASSSDGLGPDYARVEDARWIDWSLSLVATNQARLTRHLELDSSLQFNRYQIDPKSRYVYPNNVNTGWYRDDNLYGVGSLVAAEEKLAGAFDVTESLKLNATVGLAALFYDVVPRVSVPGGVETGQDLAGQGGEIEYYIERDQATSIVRRHRIASMNYQTFGGYGEVAAQLFERVQLLGGLRVDYDTRSGDAPFCPRLALAVRVFPGLTAKYIYSQAYVAPPPYYSQTTWENSRAVAIPNPDLEAERSSSHEVNLIYQEGDALYASLSAYYNKQENMLVVADTFADVNKAGSVWVGRPGNQESKALIMSANGGASTAYGGELFAKSAFWQFQAWGSYSYVDFTQDLDGVSSGLDMISRHNLRLGLTYRIIDGLYATASVIARSTPEGFVDDPAASSRWERERSWPWELDASVLYELNRNLDLFFTGTNLTNHRYASRGLYSEAFDNTSLKEGIRVWAGARFSFDTPR